MGIQSIIGDVKLQQLELEVEFQKLEAAKKKTSSKSVSEKKRKVREVT